MLLDKKHLEHLAKLARIELKESEEKKFLEDLRKILDHFQELQEVDTENVSPMAGGTESKNVWRGDEIKENRLRGDLAVNSFPEQKNRYLKTPPVFEE